jgi:hypothetical protein
MALTARRSLVLLQAALLAAMLGVPAVVDAAGEAPTITTLTSNLNPSLRGETVTFTATVKLGDGTPVTTGTVRFGRGSGCGAGFTQLQGATALDANGQARMANRDIFFGTTPIWGCYDGVAGATLSSGAVVNQTVVSALPTTLAVTPATGPFGGTVDLSATLTIQNRGTAVAGVTVTFTVNGNAAGSATTNAAGVATLSGVSLAGIGSGVYPSGVGAAFAGTSTQTASSGSADLTVTPAEEVLVPTVTTVTCAPGPFTYTGEPVTPCSVTVTADDGLSLTPDPAYTANVAAGTATASYDYPGDDTHAPSADSATFAVGQATLLVDALPASKTFGGPEPALGWTYRGFVHGEDATSAGVTGAADCARAPGEHVLGGPYPISCLPGTLSTANYRFETGDSAAFTIDPADAACHVAGFSGPYDGSAHGASGSCTGAAGEDLSAGLDLGASFTDVPGGTASWTFSASDYEPQSGSAAIEIAPAASAVTVTCPALVPYTGSAQTPCTASVTGAGGLEAPLDVAYEHNVTGIATASASYPGDRNHEPGSGSATFTIAYRWTGFLQPINDTGHQAGVGESRFRVGQTIPAKFLLLDADGNAILAGSNPTFSHSANRGSCDADAESDTLPDVDPSGGTEFRWDGTQYHFNWSTKGLTAGEYRIYANLDDGTHRFVDVCLTR